MKGTKYILLALMLVFALLSTTSVVSAKSTRIDFTVNETCNDDLVWARAWEAGPNFHFQGLTQTCIEDGSIPQATGIAYLYDGNMHFVDGQAVMTGGCRIETVEGGVWDGRWTYSAGVFNYRAHGEGIYEGQQYFSSTNQNGIYKGYILMTGK